MKCDDHTPYRPKRILAVGAHADDIDFTASGSIAAWAADGAQVEYLVITDGSKGSADSAMSPASLTKLRQREQKEAAKILGVKRVHFLKYEDGCLENSMPLKKDIVQRIRALRPDTVIVFDPSMLYVPAMNFVNHPDHRAAGQATLDAVYPLARDHLSCADAPNQLPPHKVEHLLLVNFERHNCYVNITDTLAAKQRALAAHASQLPDAATLHKMVVGRAETVGALCGYRYAEAFMRVDLPG